MKLEDAIKQKKFESALHKVMLNIIYTNSWLSDMQDVLFKEYELTPQQYNVLRILRGKFPNSISAGEIKDVMLDKNPDLTRLCDRLIKKKLIERETNEFNRRQVLIRITNKGLELLKQMDPVVKGMAKKNMNLSEKDAELLSDLLDKLRG